MLLVLLASLATGNVEIITSAALVVAFVLITGSLSTHAIALAAWRARPATQGEPPSETDPRARTTTTPMRVLVAYDGSADADVAVALVASLDWPAGSHIRLLAVVEGDLPPLSSIGAEAHPASGSLVASLQAAMTSVERSDLVVDRVTGTGQPGIVIVQEASAFDADLVVVGKRQRGFVGSWIGTSVAAQVVDDAPCPVLVARSRAARRVLLATDGSDPSAAALELLMTWAVFARSQIHVVSVAPASQGGEVAALDAILHERREVARHRAIAREAASRLRDSGRSADARVRTGDAGGRIRAVAASESVDLIVLGTRGHTGVRRMVLGSVAREILAFAAPSVLVVRRGAS